MVEQLHNNTSPSSSTKKRSYSEISNDVLVCSRKKQRRVPQALTATTIEASTILPTPNECNSTINKIMNMTIYPPLDSGTTTRNSSSSPSIVTTTMDAKHDFVKVIQKGHRKYDETITFPLLARRIKPVDELEGSDSDITTTATATATAVTTSDNDEEDVATDNKSQPLHLSVPQITTTIPQIQERNTHHDRKENKTNAIHTFQNHSHWSSTLSKACFVLLILQVIFGVILPAMNVFFDLQGGARGKGFIHTLTYPSIQRNNIIHNDDDDDSYRICCPGGGFSGFWYSLGRLKAIQLTIDNTDTTDKQREKEGQTKIKYSCFSAGCLGVVATLQNRTFEEMFDMASGIQQQWKRGVIGRYDVLPNFVDSLLFGRTNTTTTTTAFDGSFDLNHLLDHYDSSMKDKLEKMEIVTTVVSNDRNGFKYVARTPKNMLELREMLIQTAWIPYATGDFLWAKDSITKDRHMDGAFSAHLHPKCDQSLGLPLRLDLIFNGLNINLQHEKAEQFWNIGMQLQ